MKSSILFVEDDAKLLSGLQRTLRRQRESWEMTFVETPQQALGLLKQRDFDVVVSDMRMPDLDGASLLSEVERHYPGTIRVILSGYAEEQSLYHSFGSAHHYVAKPCEADILVALMERTRELRTILAEPPLRQLAAGLRHLPSPPTLYLRLTAEMERETASSASVARMIGEDVAMTAELLKITNSSYFSLSASVSSPVQAVRLLGLETVRTLVLQAGIFKQYQGNSMLAKHLDGLNRYGLAVGELARRLAGQDGADQTRQDLVFCAAMLSSIGALVLLDSFPLRYRQLLENVEDGGLEAAEQVVFGASHCALGAYLLGLWGFTDPIIEAVLFHLSPSACCYQQKSLLTYLHLARTGGPAFPLLVPSANGGKSRSLGGPDQDYLKRCGWSSSGGKIPYRRSGESGLRSAPAL